MTENKHQGKKGYETVNGLKMYYEIHGKGNPLVLLHGAFSNGETDFATLVPGLAKDRQVILIDQQGHGRTEDIDRPLRLAHMADDTVELLKKLHIEKADFFGYSVGGAVALHIAKRHPEVVRKIVSAGGTSYTRDGFYPEALAPMPAEVLVQALNGTLWQQAYAKIAPNPENWATLIAKKIEMDAHITDWDPKELQAIEAPVLLVIGDSDIVKPEHTAQMFRLLGGGVMGDMSGLPKSQLAVLPGTTHVTLLFKTEALLSMIPAFLDAPIPSAKTQER